jgi:hypothetical protein
VQSAVGGGELALRGQDASVDEGLDALFLRHAANAIHGALHGGLQRIGDKARAIMEALLEKYSDQGIESVESPDALKIIPFPTIGTPVEIVMAFGGRNQFQSAMRDFKNQLYCIV